jgi:hypothetical protein
VRGGPWPQQGAYVTPYLPSKAVPTAVTLIFTRNPPLKMTLGQWNFLCQDYFAGEEADMLLSEEEDPSDVDPLGFISNQVAEANDSSRAG